MISNQNLHAESIVALPAHILALFGEDVVLPARCEPDFDRVRRSRLTSPSFSAAELGDPNPDLLCLAADLEILLDFLPLEIAIAYDLNCTVMRGNKSFCEAVGVPAFETPSKIDSFAAGSRFRIIRDGAELSPSQLSMQSETQAGASFDHTECEIKRADGRTMRLQGHALPLFDHSGAIKGSIGIFIEQTERPNLIRELKRSNAELESFAHSVSHDLQEPLRVVSCFAELLALTPNAEERKIYKEYIQGAAARMRDLIAGLLEYAKVGLDKAPVLVSCDAALDEALSSLQIAIRESDAVISRDRFPSILFDRFISQVFQNLISNAIKYRGSARPEIHLSVQDRGHEWLFSVRDNGVGLDISDVQEIFLPFRRINDTRGDGAGVGLAICKRIIEKNGGSIFVETSSAAGSVFCFTIPRSAVVQQMHA